jgi:phosphatidylglycerol:prolipoprotein diacylglycerol transferase
MSFIPFPEGLTPEIFSVDLGPVTLALRWYAMAYVVGLLGAWKLIVKMVETPRLWSGPAPMRREQVDSLLTWIILGVIIGGRLGYVILYQPAQFLARPQDIIKVWEGGMSFHGGFAGVIVAGLIFARREKIDRLALSDLMAATVPIGILLGRLANFINAELWGRPTTMPWGVAFPGEAAQSCANIGDICSRHPSQLYEAALEGLILLVLFIWMIWRRGALMRPGLISGLFFAGYGIGRFIVEFFRQPDFQFITPDNPLGLYIHSGGWGLTAGQVLSLPMILVGLWFIARSRRIPA